MATTGFPPIGGAGNNLTHPELDAVPGSAELNLAPLHFAPGTERGLVGGPDPRLISNALSAQAPGVSIPDPTGISGFAYVWGQFIDHDISLKKSGTQDISITVGAGDPDLPEGTVIPLTMAAVSAAGTEVNTVSGYLDLSQVYGSDAATAASLRNANGTMKTTADGQALSMVDGHFVAGDVRVEENPDLVAITTLWVKNHNRIVGDLRAAHHDWTGDRLYGEARKLNIAEFQHVTYTEFLPALIGPIRPYMGYAPNVNPQVTQEFSVAAFRVGHSEVSDEQAGSDQLGVDTFVQTLSEAFANTPVQTLTNGINALLRDLANDDSQAVDLAAVDGLRNLLVAPPNAVDLIATDIQRERDAGLGSLNETRVALGLSPYTSFDQLTSDLAVAAKLESVFGSIDNVDLFMGGLAEDHAPTGTMGETFRSIIADQFVRLRDGDRFFFQNEQFDAKTTKLINDTTFGDILSRNTDTPALQENVFFSADRHASDVAAADPTAAQLVIGIDADNAAIAGGPADDTIVAGLGTDQTLTGGGGADTFLFVNPGTSDTITDFEAGLDDIRVTFSAADFNVSATPDGGSLIDYGDSRITVAGIAPSQLSAADFVLPPGSETVPKFLV